jgi:hypothetical protein
MDEVLFAAGLVVFGVVLALAVVFGSFLGSYWAQDKHEQDRLRGRKRP